MTLSSSPAGICVLGIGAFCRPARWAVTKLTHFRLSKLPNFNCRYVRLCDLDIPGANKMAEVFANSGNPDQTSLFAASDLDLRCLLVALFGASRLKWVKQTYIAVST